MEGRLAGNFVLQALKEGLYTRVVGRRILSYPRLSSTMDQAVQEARQGTQEGTVILATEQTAGRGRFQRSWVSRPGNLLLSIVFYPSLQALPFLSIIASLAIVRTIRMVTSLRPTIKWPNDILIHGKKVCGLLVENALEGDAVNYAVVGIGLNVALRTAKIPELTAIATSLNLETGQEVELGLLLRRLLHEMDDLYFALSGGESPIAEWRHHLETLGRQVTVQWRDDVVTGYAQDVDERGHLVLRQAGGTLVALAAGEVTFQAMPGGPQQ